MGDPKKVMVVMDEDLHRILKALAAAYDCTISDLVSLSVEPAVNRLGLYCSIGSEVLNWHQYPLNPKGEKWCWGSQCVNCIHRKACDRGDYEGFYQTATPENCLVRPSDKALGVPCWIADDFVEEPFDKSNDV